MGTHARWCQRSRGIDAQEITAAGGVSYVPEFLAKVKSKECKLMGFGHRVYKNTDPRAHQMKRLCHEVLNSLGEQGDPTLRPLLEVAMALEEAALKDEYFTKRKLFPNVDFYSGITHSDGFPTSMFTVLFAIGRSAGWIAQWRESVEESGRKIRDPDRSTPVCRREYSCLSSTVRERITSVNTSLLLLSAKCAARALIEVWFIPCEEIASPTKKKQGSYRSFLTSLEKEHW